MWVSALFVCYAIFSLLHVFLFHFCVVAFAQGHAVGSESGSLHRAGGERGAGFVCFGCWRALFGPGSTHHGRVGGFPWREFASDLGLVGHAQGGFCFPVELTLVGGCWDCHCLLLGL